MTTTLGLAAGVLTTSCWVPQLVRAYRTRSTGDISWVYVAALGGGIVLWLAYGTIQQDTALVAANVATVLALAALASFKWRFDGRGRSLAPGARIEAVLLDMDGTLVNSHAAVERAWRQWAREFAVDHARIEPIMHGSPPETTVRLVAPELGDAETSARQRSASWSCSTTTSTTWCSQTAPTSCCSGSPRQGCPGPWSRAPTPGSRGRDSTPPASTRPCSSRSTTSPPASPTPRASCLRRGRLGVPIERCLVVEDSAPGAEAGRRAGALVAGLRGLPADVPVDDLADVASLLPLAA